MSKGNWTNYSDSKLRVIDFKSYDDYLRNQKGKLDRLLKDENCFVYEQDRYLTDVLSKRLAQYSFLKRGANVLCLGARFGAEVQVFLDLGCFAVGIDLNPGPENKLVVHGDFHDIQYPDASIDAIYSNSLDHVLDLDKVMSECLRVLNPNGHIILEIVHGTAEGVNPGYHESFFWEKAEDVVSYLKKFPLEEKNRESFEIPWLGEHLLYSINSQT